MANYEVIKAAEEQGAYGVSADIRGNTGSSPAHPGCVMGLEWKQYPAREEQQMEVVVELSETKVTKNTVRFEEIDPPDGMKVGAVYLPKHVVAQLGHPKKIKITVESVA